MAQRPSNMFDYYAEGFGEKDYTPYLASLLRSIEYREFEYKDAVVTKNLQEILDSLISIQEHALTVARIFGRLPPSTASSALSDVVGLVEEFTYFLHACLEEINDPEDDPADNAKYVIGELNGVWAIYLVLDRLADEYEKLALDRLWFENVECSEGGVTPTRWQAYGSLSALVSVMHNVHYDCAT